MKRSERCRANALRSFAWAGAAICCAFALAVWVAALAWCTAGCFVAALIQLAGGLIAYAQLSDAAAYLRQARYEADNDLKQSIRPRL